MFDIFGSIGAGGTGVLSGIDSERERKDKQYQMQGMQALGKAFMPQMQQGPIDQMNMRGPQPPMPGQASMPQQQPVRMPQPQPQMPQQPMGQPMPQGGGGMPPQQAPMGPPQGQPQMGPQSQGDAPGGMPQFDLRTLASRIQQTNPGLPPQAMFYALTKAAPLLNIEGKQQLMQLRQQFQQESLGMRERNLDRQERADQTRALQGGERIDIQRSREDRMKGQFEDNQKRLRENADRRFDDSAKRLDEMTKRRLSMEDRSKAALELRTVEDQNRAAHNAMMEQIQSNWLLDDTEKKRLLGEATKRRDENQQRIEQYRERIKAGGMGKPDVTFTPPGANKEQGRVPSGGQWVKQPDGSMIWTTGQ